MAELERLVETEQHRLFKSAYMRVGNRADAEDIVQDVFLKLFCSGEALNNVQNLQFYLIRSVNNACQDFHRRKTVIFVPIEAADTMPESDDDREIHEEYLRINRLLDKIPPEQAEVLRLKCIDDLKFKEIAELLGIPEATAKSRYRYAIDHIQNQLNN